MSSLTEGVHAQIMGLSTSQEVWNHLAATFAGHSKARIMQLRLQMHQMKKGADTMSEYLLKAKTIADQLVMALKPIDNDDYILYILEGLGPEYGPFCTSITTRDGHIALHCHNRFNHAFLPENGSPANALYAAQSYPHEIWYPDSGATNHITSDLANLSLHSEYTGNDSMKVGDGTGLPIQHIGNSSLHTTSSTFHLNDILHVPSITKNLLSVHRFTRDNNVFFEFHPNHFYIKDRRSGKLLFQGTSKGGLYQLIQHQGNTNKEALIGERQSIIQWHNRLGPPAFHTVHKVLARFALPVISNKVHDDSLIFPKADFTEASNLKDILRKNGQISGQVINFSKSSLSFSWNTSWRFRVVLANHMQMRCADGSEMYLGLPSSLGRKKA
ncbi:hypothetical protein HHK36_011260 [Tetracentron sinense]|uniref:Retrovirus-related Pol polyprotein from transposon TNT 1-94-like beta-barrel domain-containing protein n=1 Tax=Tetracentron sinense TaxID=13715 RepID=A0A834ZD54_TETSI|nr:hypothetical protein HHK36_011260 [Tetracentron sinense]